MDGSGNASESRYLMDGEPAQIAFEPRTSCQDKEQESIIKDTKSYQASLSNDISVGGMSSNKLIFDIVNYFWKRLPN